ncbi:MAG: hypothetical protein WD425_12060 [Nitrospirales bacterium]
METVEYRGQVFPRSYVSTNQELRDIFLRHRQGGLRKPYKNYDFIPHSPVFSLSAAKSVNEESVKIIPMMVIQKVLGRFESERCKFRGAASFPFRKEPENHIFAPAPAWG